jgi:hypothetical protein
LGASLWVSTFTKIMWTGQTGISSEGIAYSLM